MWVQAGFPPRDFYEQTPRHFQLAMEGARKKAEAESRTALRNSYENAALSGLAYHGKLKSFQHYVSGEGAPQTPVEMLGLFKSMGARSNMTIRRVKRDNPV